MGDKPIRFSAPMIRALLDGRKTKTRRVLKPQPTPCGGKLPGAIFSNDMCWPTGYGSGIVSNKPFPPAGYLDVHPIKFAIGDRLWVKEAWRARLYNQAVPPRDIDPWATRLHFDADGQPPECDDGTNWDRLRASIHMPRWMSRLTLTVTDVRVQRLQEISEADAVAEGVEPIRYEWWQGFVRNPDGSRSMMEAFGPSDAPPADFEHPERQVIEKSATEGFRSLWNSLHGPDAWDANPWVCALTFTTHPRNIDQIEAPK